jgi:hypothetical protein
MAEETSKGFHFVPPADSLRDDSARFAAHVVVIGVALALALGLAGAVTMMSVIYWGG